MLAPARSGIMVIVSMALPDVTRGEDVGGQVNAGRLDAVHEVRSQAGRHDVALHLSGAAVDTCLLEQENVLQGDRLAFHTHLFGYVRHASSAVSHSIDMDDH